MSHYPQPPPSVRLQFSAELGVHAVIDLDDVYYFDRSFIRIRDGIWQVSSHAGGPWRRQPIEWVPFSLRLKHFEEERPSPSLDRSGSNPLTPR